MVRSGMEMEKNDMSDGMKTEHIDACPECGTDDIKRDERNELVCQCCGLVVQESTMDRSPKAVYSFEETSTKTQSGPKMTVMLHDKGLSTKISEGNKDSNGGRVSQHKAASLRKMERRMRLSKSKDKRLMKGLKFIKEIASKHDLPTSVEERAAHLFRKLSERSFFKGRSCRTVSVALLYLACKEQNIPRVLDEFSEHTDIPTTRLFDVYKKIKNNLGVGLKPTQPEEFVNKFCTELGFNNGSRKVAKSVIDLAKKENLVSGKSPTGIAGGAVYLVKVELMGDNSATTQSEISDIAQVTEVTIRTRYKELKELVNGNPSYKSEIERTLKENSSPN